MKIKPLVIRNGNRIWTEDADGARADGNAFRGYRGDIPGKLPETSGPQTAQAPTGPQHLPGVLVINEIDADTPGTDVLEFVEIYDGGLGNMSLNGYVLVFFNGSNDLSYAAFDLDGYTTDANGYFVAGNSAVAGVDLVFNNGSLQNGQDAVALYLGNAADFPTNTAPTTTNLIDAVVYDNGQADDTALLASLGETTQYNENENMSGASQSLSRVPNETGGFVAQAPTPGASNTASALPTLSITDVSMTEGDAGTLTYTFAVTLSAPAGAGGVTFNIATADGTATIADGDYVQLSLTGQTIPTGSVGPYNFSVTVNGDVAFEPNETFFVNITSVTGATVLDGQGLGTIVNNDPAPPSPGTLSISGDTRAEGDSGMTLFSFTVSRTGGDNGIVSADYEIILPGGMGGADATDIPGSLTGTVTFGDGVTTQTITVAVAGDVVNEPTETFTVELSNAQGGASIGVDTATGTITNDDAPPTISIGDASLVEGNNGVTYLVFTVSLSKVSVDPVTVDFTTAGVTAVDGNDFLGLSGQVRFVPGDTSETISIPLIGDTVPENNETLTVTLSNPSGATITDGSGAGTITNDDGPQYYSLAGGSFTQDWTSTGQITANDNWSGVPYIIGYLGDIDPGSSTNVDARTLTGANLGAVDVIANLPNTTSNSGGVGEFQITNPVIGLQGSGTADAPSIVLYMDATGRSSVRLQANIRDIDSTVAMSVEDNAAQQINVQYRTSPGGTWINVPNAYFADVTGLNATQVTALDVILPPGADNAATLEIRIMTTNAAGNDEWVGIDDIVVSSQVGAPSLSIANAAVIEDDAGATLITFTVTRTGSSTGAATADYTVLFGSGPFDAEADDFTAAPLAGQVSFADGQTTATITLSVDGDLDPEVDENFTVALSNASGATIGDGSATGTIVNDDGPPPLVTINDVTVVEGDSNTVLMTFTVTRTGGTGAFSVDWQTSDGSATAGSDYAAASGTVNFAPGQMSDTVTVAVTINGDTDSELSETLQVTLGNATNFAVVTDPVGIGTIASDDPIFIHDIQGTSYFSPILAGEGINSFNVASVGTVIVRAVVTAVDSDGLRQGFYLQEEIADWDANPFTSEGIFVFTGTTVSGVNVGDIVTVTARVMEYQGFSTNMPVTTLTSPTSIVVNSTGNALPALTLGAMPTAIMTPVQPDYTDSSDGVGDSFDASLYALSYWETVEGMLVTVPDVVVADGFYSTSGSQPIFQAYSQSLTDADQINSRGGLTIAGDPPVGPPDTPETEDDTTNGGRALTDGDINPDIIEIDFSGFALDAPGGFAGTLSMGDELGDITGIIDFDFTDRKLFVTDYDPGSFVDHTTTQDVTLLGGDSRSLTVATFNVENLDPGDLASKFQGLAAAIANNLNAPDIICIEEMQDNNGAAAGDGIDDDPNTSGIQDATGADASESWQMLVDALNLATGKNYQWVDQEPTYNAEGGEQSGNIRVGFLYDTDRVQLGDLDANATLAERRQYTDRIGDGVRDANDLIAFDDSMLNTEIQAGDWAGTRRSLLGEFTFNGNIVYVTANHFPAKSQSDDFWEFNQNPAGGEPTNAAWTQRNAVAQDVYSMLNLIEQNSNGAGIVSGGDYNDFYFYRPLTTVTGHTMADGTARVGGARFENLTLTLDEAERYTYTFDGRSQAIDHVIVNGLLGDVASYDVVHLNTGFNPTGNPALSDHDPALASFDYRSFAEVLAGTAGNDIINGFGGDDIVTGGAGQDFLIGGTGTDRLEGGADGDTYLVDGADLVIEAVGQGMDAVYAMGSYALAAGQEIEVLDVFDRNSTVALDLTGNAFSQGLVGNAGNNVLNGAGGPDVYYGLGGNDAYFVWNAGDQVFEYAGEGSDTVYALVSYALTAGSEVEVLSAFDLSATFAQNLTGNALSQGLIGNAGGNVLNGGGGPDTYYGLGGNDAYFVWNTGDQVFEFAGQGTDTVYALVSYALTAGSEVEVLSAFDLNAAFALDLTGNALGQGLVGNAGANVLNGLGGADVLYGLGGADIFAFTAALGSGNIDTIADFTAIDDTIALDDAIFTAIGATGTLNASAFVVGNGAADASDRIIYNSLTGQLLYDADGVGGVAAIQFATLSPGLSLQASDFVVI